MDAKEALADCLHTLSVLEEDWYLSSGPYGESADPEANAEMKKSVDKLRSMLIERDALKAELAAARPLLDAAMAFNGKVDEKTGIIHGGDVHALAYIALAYRAGRAK
jgi:hypothetical protein